MKNKPKAMTPTNNPFDAQVEKEAKEYGLKRFPKGALSNWCEHSTQDFIAGAYSKAVTNKIAELEKQLDGNYIFTPEQLADHDSIVILKHEESKRATHKPLTP